MGRAKVVCIATSLITRTKTCIIALKALFDGLEVNLSSISYI